MMTNRRNPIAAMPPKIIMMKINGLSRGSEILLSVEVLVVDVVINVVVVIVVVVIFSTTLMIIVSTMPFPDLSFTTRVRLHVPTIKLSMKLLRKYFL
jgi:hypothetical protein